MSLSQSHHLLLLFFVSSVVIAQASGQAGGQTSDMAQLPESYRTPLSDMVYQDMKPWRSEAKEDNPWREGEKQALIEPRIKLNLLPQYNYHSLENPMSDSLFQNENEIERPVSNILQLSF